MIRALGLLLLLARPPQDDIVDAGREHWGKPWMPELSKPGGKVEIPAEKRIDVLILGDGYVLEERKAFEADVEKWYAGFLKLNPWSRFRGAFRVRGLWTASEGRATPDRKSRYRLPATAFGVGDSSSAETRRAVFEAIDRADCNRAQARGRLTHTTVVMLMKNEFGRNPSGMSRNLSSPDGKAAVGVAFAAYTHHEFGHAYGGLRDEYILGIGNKAVQKTPERASIFTVLNVSYVKEARLLPWAHLSPGGAVNPDKDSVIGVLWLGGVAEEGAWHSEAKCLMNGTHENWDLQKTKRGAYLRDMTRFCFWCEEILAARTFERAGLLGDSQDGEELWKKWAEEVRPLCHKAFDVPGRIRMQNLENAKVRLQEAKIYERP
jgi:hypothetical protein